jgi:hypothetical protein
VPRLQSYKARGLQAEARGGLAGIQVALQAYFSTHGTYPEVPQGTDPAGELGQKLGIRLPKEGGLYRFSLHSEKGENGKPGRWVAGAVSVRPIRDGIGTLGHDHLRMNMNRWTCSPFDGMKQASALNATTSRPSDPKQCPESTRGESDWKVQLTQFDVD